MTRRTRCGAAGLLAFTIASSATAIAGQQETKPEAPVLTTVSPKETAPTSKKSTTVFDPLEMQGFSASLLLGELRGGATPDSLPEGAKKALSDLREFLPYKSYRLLDTQWVRCCAGPNVFGRLRGLDEQQYTFQMGISSVAAPRFTANFSLWDANVDMQSSSGKKPVISSNFSMETGETVVIGTSSLKGDKALVVLLTAVPEATASKTKKGSMK